jgi:hypothetical protein
VMAMLLEVTFEGLSDFFCSQHNVFILMCYKCSFFIAKSKLFIYLCGVVINPQRYSILSICARPCRN